MRLRCMKSLTRWALLKMSEYTVRKRWRRAFDAVASQYSALAAAIAFNAGSAFKVGAHSVRYGSDRIQPGTLPGTVRKRER